MIVLWYLWIRWTKPWTVHLIWLDRSRIPRWVVLSCGWSNLQQRFSEEKRREREREEPRISTIVRVTKYEVNHSCVLLLLTAGTLISYNSAISATEKAGEWQMAIHLMEELITRQLLPDIITYNTVTWLWEFQLFGYVDALSTWSGSVEDQTSDWSKLALQRTSAVISGNWCLRQRRGVARSHFPLLRHPGVPLLGWDWATASSVFRIFGSPLTSFNHFNHFHCHTNH